MSSTITKKQVAIVTGASSGIGMGITQALLQHGYCVVANSRNISNSKDLKPSSDLILVDDISKKDSAIKVPDTSYSKTFGITFNPPPEQNQYHCFGNIIAGM